MESHVAARLVQAEVPAVRKAVAVLAAQLWGDRSRTLLDAGDERIDAIASDVGAEGPGPSPGPSADISADVWVTWRVSARPGGTRLELRVDALDTGPDPTPELEHLLDAIAARVEAPTRA
jgi:hypothetical protein